MSTTQPIRNKKDLQNFKDYYRNNIRNRALIIVGLNTALRISDILHLTYDAVYEGSRVRTHIVVKERKTGKENCILINKETRKVLEEYRKTLCQTAMHREGNPYLFPSPRCASQPLSRCQAFRIISTAARETGQETCISCHSLRKTFGYHAWKQGIKLAVIMNILNHSSMAVTMRYLCIAQDDKDEAYRAIRL